MSPARLGGAWRRVRCRIPHWAAVAVLAALALAGCTVADAPTEVRSDSFSVGTATVVDVDTFNGSITVQNGSSGVVSVEATLRGPDNVEYNASRIGNVVTITGEDRRRSFFGGVQAGVSLLITVPGNAELRLRSSNGAIEVTGVAGDLELGTSNGAIRLNGATGRVVATTSNGRITVSGFTGELHGVTSNGAISFEGTLRESSHTELRTSNGSITVNIGDDENVTLDATTSNGDITAEVPLVVEHVSDTRLTGSMGDGHGLLQLSTSNGSITIR